MSGEALKFLPRGARIPFKKNRRDRGRPGCSTYLIKKKKELKSGFRTSSEAFGVPFSVLSWEKKRQEIMCCFRILRPQNDLQF